MTGDLWALAGTILLATVQLTISSVVSLRQLGGNWILSPRDQAREVSGLSGRFVRAYRNLLESFPLFAASLFLVHAAHANGWLTTAGAWTFLIGRTLYVPAYAFAPPGIRPACWLGAQLGVFLIVADVFL